MIDIVPASAGMLRNAALTLVYGRLPAGERERQLAATLTAAERGEFSLDDLLVALAEGQAIGAMLIIRRPGGAAFVWPPAAARNADGPEVARRLLGSAAELLDAAGVRYAQCLLEPDDAEGRGLMERGGFPCVTDMLLLSRPAWPPVELAGQPVLAARGYEDSRFEEFGRIIERTCVDSFDCPALTRLRRGSEMLSAQRAEPSFDPALWQVFRAGEADVGVLLASDQADGATREITYLGVVPEARRRGIGREILACTLAAAARAGREMVEVAVDANNHPAVALYARVGFEEARRLSVHLRAGA